MNENIFSTSITVFVDDKGRDIATLRTDADGIPAHHGADLKSVLDKCVFVDRSTASDMEFEGIGCCAVQTVAMLKGLHAFRLYQIDLLMKQTADAMGDTEMPEVADQPAMKAGYLHLVFPGQRDADFIYKISKKDDRPWLMIEDREGSTLFMGFVDDFDPEECQKGVELQ